MLVDWLPDKPPAEFPVDGETVELAELSHQMNMHSNSFIITVVAFERRALCFYSRTAGHVKYEVIDDSRFGFASLFH